MDRMFSKKKKRTDEKQEDTESSSDASIFSSEGSFAVENRQESKVQSNALEKAATAGVEGRRQMPVLKDWGNLAAVMNKLTILPSRFSRKKKKQVSKAQELARAAAAEDEDQMVERLLVFFKPNSKFKEMVLDDIAPWLVVTLNNVWVPVTNRLLQMLYCENFPLGNIRLMMSTNIECWNSDIHNHLSIIGISGLVVWSLGIVTGLYIVIKSKE